MSYKKDLKWATHDSHETIFVERQRYNEIEVGASSSSEPSSPVDILIWGYLTLFLCSRDSSHSFSWRWGKP